ncbi:MAG: zinc-binding alcohol dehydrogenase [Marmoricola sp.]|nr:zinc-binding alcohol dehydrogenase [Marmoricola sp.]
MPEPRTIRTLGVAAQDQPAFSSYVEQPPGKGEFRVDTVYTGLSAGTELTFVKGTNPYLHASWDAERGAFLEGEPSRSYPVESMGYMEVGRVTETRTDEVSVGQLVALAYGHRSGHVIDPRRSVATVLPSGLDPLLGIYVAQMGPICANGLLHASAELVGAAPADPEAVQLGDGVRGQRVLVIGAGVVGLLTGLFARAHGAAEVAVADPDPQRLAAAEGLGLLPVPDDGSGSVEQWSTTRWQSGPGDRGADLVFQCRGRAPALATALRSLRPQGTVIDLAFYEGGAPDLRLGEEFHHKGLTLRCAQINRVPRGLASAWDRRRLCAETITLLAEHGHLVRKHLVTDVVPFDEGATFISELAERRRSCIQAVFAL